MTQFSQDPRQPHQDREAIINSEKDFHNQLFQNGFDSNARQVANKYYRTTEASKQYYTKSILDRCSGRTVLEYGCGPDGMVFDAVAAGARHSTGIDISETAIEHSVQKARQTGVSDRTDFYVMDAEDLKFPDSTFDVVFGSGILHHLDLSRSLAEITRVLTPSGVAVFLEPLGHNPFINLYRRLTPRMRTPDEHPLTMADLRNLPRFFNTVDLHFYSLCTLLLSPFSTLPFFKFGLSVAEKVDSLLFKIPLLRKYAWVVVITVGDPIKPPANAGGSGADSPPAATKK